MNIDGSESKDSLNARFDRKGDRLDINFDRLEAKIDAYHRVRMRMMAITLFAVIMPYIERLMAL